MKVMIMLPHGDCYDGNYELRSIGMMIDLNENDITWITTVHNHMNGYGHSKHGFISPITI